MDNPNNDIEGVLKKFSLFRISPKKDAEIMKALSNLHIQRSFEAAKGKAGVFVWLEQVVFSKKGLVSVLAVFALSISGVLYYNATNSYSYHLNKAKEALGQLQETLKGRGEANLLFGTVLAAESDSRVDESAVEEHTENVVSETEEAIEATNRIDRADETAHALGEVGAVQDETVDTLADAAEVIQADSTATVVTQALQTTTQEQTAVEEAKKAVESAVAKGIHKVKIHVSTSKDKTKKNSADDENNRKLTPEDVTKMADDAKTALSSLISSGEANTEDVTKLADKQNMIDEALKQGKLGRVRGLSTALEAKIRNVLRKAEKKNGPQPTENPNPPTPGERHGKGGDENSAAVGPHASATPPDLQR